MFLPIVANCDGRVMNEALNLAMFENSFHPGVSTRRMGHSFAALGSDLRLHNLPDWTAILTIKSCPHVAQFILRKLSEKVNNKQSAHTLREGEGGGPRIEGIAQSVRIGFCY